MGLTESTFYSIEAVFSWGLIPWILYGYAVYYLIIQKVFFC